MATASTRPLSENERRSIARFASSDSLIAFAWFPTLFAFVITFAIGVGIERALGIYCTWGTTWPTIIGAIAGVSFAYYLHNATKSFRDKQREAHAKDLAAGTAVCTTFDVVDALRVEEFEDEGSTYYLKLADGRVLFMQGQYLYEYEEGIDEDDGGKPVPAKFPAERFTVERTAASGTILDVTGFGRAIPVSGALPAFTQDQFRNGDVPQDGDILTIDFETLRRR